jgi:hypothetical protein
MAALLAFTQFVSVQVRVDPPFQAFSKAAMQQIANLHTSVQI